MTLPSHPRTERRPWELYPLHIEALVWDSPVIVGNDDNLRAILGHALYRWASVPASGDPLIDLQYSAERSTYRGLMAFASGYTGGGTGPLHRRTGGVVR